VRAPIPIHMLRRIVAPALAVVTLASAAAAPAGARSEKQTRKASAMRALETGVLADVNRIRSRHGLKRLRLSPKLTAAAMQHSREMGRRGYFSHDSANGAVFWRRIARYYGSSGYRYWVVGENLLWSSPDVDATGALKMWMRSPEHRANLLNREWREIGLAAVHLASAPGTFSGLQGVTIMTADFGARRR
jgi:uncharacterized protein YkwD